MKKIVILLIILTLLLTACQATPEDEVVVQKDTEAMLEMASEPQEELRNNETLKDKLGAPDRVQETITEADGKLVINIDTEVTVPDVDRVPVMTVESADFTQTNADGLINVLYKGVTPYELSLGRATKSEIEQAIVNLEEIRLNYLDNANELEIIDQEINSLKQEHQNAPEISEDIKTVSNGQLKLFSLDDEAFIGDHYYYGLKLNTNKNINEDQYLELRNRPFKMSNPDKPTDLNALLYYQNNAVFDYHTNANEPIRLDENFNVSTGILDKAGFSPDEAMMYAQEVLDEIGADMMELNRAYIIDNEYKGNSDGKIAPASNYAYRMLFTREVENIPCVYTTESAEMDESSGYSFVWDYEKLEIIFNKDGIARLSWVSPIIIKSIYTDNTSLIGFDEVYQRFEAHAKTKYSYFGDNLKTININIDRIALEYQRMKLTDGDYGTAILCPVWNFYGIITKEYTSGSNSNPDFLISINALDGSVFDQSKGY